MRGETAMKAKKIDLIRTFELAFKKDLDEREFLLFLMARHGRDLPREEFLAAMNEWKATFDADYEEKKRQHEENQSMAKFALRVLALAGATEENGIKFGEAVEIASLLLYSEALFGGTLDSPVAASRGQVRIITCDDVRTLAGRP